MQAALSWLGVPSLQTEVGLTPVIWWGFKMSIFLCVLLQPYINWVQPNTTATPIGVHGLTPQVLYSYMDLDPSDTPPKYAAAGQRYWTHPSSIGLSYASYLRWGLFLAFPPSRRHTGPAWNLLLPMFDLLISYSPQSRYMLSNNGFFIKTNLQFEVIRECLESVDQPK